MQSQDACITRAQSNKSMLKSREPDYFTGGQQGDNMIEKWWLKLSEDLSTKEIKDLVNDHKKEKTRYFLNKDQIQVLLDEIGLIAKSKNEYDAYSDMLIYTYLCRVRNEDDIIEKIFHDMKSASHLLQHDKLKIIRKSIDACALRFPVNENCI